MSTGASETPGVAPTELPVKLPEIEPQSNPWVDLRQYDQAGFERGRSNWVILLWWLVQAVVFPLTLHNLHGPRCWLLRLFGARIGQGVAIRPTARITYPWKLTVGDHAWIGDDVVLYSLEQIQIGAHSVVSQKCYLCTGSHDIQDPTFRLLTQPIVIEPGAWVAADCFIGPGVTVGANAVVGARSSVFTSLPPAQVCWGSPCKPRYPRKMRSSTDTET
ncbi:hormogonium polysaccharide biosynthesis acetyltransferase HpsU [Leptolyngbya sp. FACHB-261]|uniref:hormogonium polysaccharide biosynthesis acetyltransferase HpsU n=1 Tax=Leptolyngbya sp. FACHB-261 TaxID=2692806 RepID=UPI0016870C73|nr:hormogonium polysaccharide biosynthesis acetyltransferase HpsU [Leptolyngbya sp. FACHB-261]MBD2103408.1 colanic acid biosynthesis acetyltransferase WcaF [Leptolyngbya sp. FACHB-261]